jgi:hypothetical protein
MAMAAMVIGLGISIVGTIMQMQAAQKAAAAQQKALAAQQRAEASREQAMRIDAQRKKRETIRQSIIQRSQALSAGTNQGAQYGTALPGAYGQIQGNAAAQYGTIGVQESIGAEIFAQNRQVLSARKEEAAAGAQAALGSGISSLGGAVGRGLGSIGRMS